MKHRKVLSKNFSHLVAFFVFSGLTLLLSACGGTTGSREAPVVRALTDNVYRIGESDEVRIDVWKNAELSVNVTVRPDGMITMPLIGDVPSSGKTTQELANDITVALSDYVRTPQVTVIVNNPASADFRNRVRVTGAVNQQVSTAYRDGMTVMDLVLSAGGLTEFAAPNKTLLYRKNEQGEVKAYAVMLKRYS